MTVRQKEDLIELAAAALGCQTELLPEGRPHARARRRMESLRRDHLHRTRREVHLASGLPVQYPGEPEFCPDLMVVAERKDPGDTDTRTAWVVVEERKAEAERAELEREAADEKGALEARLRDR